MMMPKIINKINLILTTLAVKLLSKGYMVMDREVVVLIEEEAAVNFKIGVVETVEIVKKDLEVVVSEKIEKLMNRKIKLYFLRKKMITLQIN